MQTLKKFSKINKNIYNFTNYLKFQKILNQMLILLLKSKYLKKWKINKQSKQIQIQFIQLQVLQDKSNLNNKKKLKKVMQMNLVFIYNQKYIQNLYKKLMLLLHQVVIMIQQEEFKRKLFQKLQRKNSIYRLTQINLWKKQNRVAMSLILICSVVYLKIKKIEKEIILKLQAYFHQKSNKSKNSVKSVRVRYRDFEEFCRKQDGNL
ncbi:hypothetical protein IMG5_169490 [Ichthyophthirius multifiliis]|uniref:Uncharacterized protein n=1 Tax=Ichthyophthirius multifiliis TaxID=5932 RepID=G0R1B9_ICHMU|nr:hypothetical protein IMG5_169490 [Ichthyophthirius multifiliis]EGR28752.1 hypothetical protein IMG5_169490 [Ichthyophthirius multifiliis]|eukprot:XP_004029988.1 hypothetical protein IMG5_169490 [Ichthyophthirius multifiliis]